ncbi:MAG: proton-conducting transporter membrane subunit [bacterium]|nr:proton-conducting transporter membrane subunit [bacterium]
MFESTSAMSIGIVIGMVGAATSGIIALALGARVHRLAQWILAVTAGVGAIASIAFLLSEHATIDIVYFTGSYGMRFSLHRLSAVFMVIVHVVTACAAVYATRYIGEHGSPYRPASVDALLAWFVLGMQSVLLATDIMTFMVCWEVMSIASFFLVMADREERSMHAAFLYLVMTHLGAAAILTGFFVVSNGDLTASFATIAAHARTLTSGSVLLAFVCFLFGFGSKAGLVPLHVWLPEAHPQAPSHVSALMSGAMIKIAVYGFVLVTFLMLPPLAPGYGAVVMGIGLLSGVFGALYATVNTDIKQTLAWSSIENIGLVFVMLGTSMFAASSGLQTLASIAVTAALYHCVVHAFCKSGLFLTAGAIVHAVHTRNLEEMGGLAKRMPVLAGAFLVLVLTAAALPPFGVFFGEWMFLQGVIGTLVHSGPTVAAVLVVMLCTVVLVSALAMFAMVKLFVIAALGLPRSHHAEGAHEPNVELRIPILVTAALGLGAGIFAPQVLAVLGAAPMLHTSAFGVAIAPPGASLAPAMLTVMLLAALTLAYVIRACCVLRLRTRVYHTWDCGQPIHAGMEYTATAFSAPIRFFFRALLQTRKELTAAPILSMNTFVARHTMVMRSRSVWLEYLYLPIARFFLRQSIRMKRIQSGVIQFYLILMFVALLATLIIAV